MTAADHAALATRARSLAAEYAAHGPNGRRATFPPENADLIALALWSLAALCKPSAAQIDAMLWAQSERVDEGTDSAHMRAAVAALLLRIEAERRAGKDRR